MAMGTETTGQHRVFLRTSPTDLQPMDRQYRQQQELQRKAEQDRLAREFKSQREQQRLQLQQQLKADHDRLMLRLQSQQDQQRLELERQAKAENERLEQIGRAHV